MIDKLKFTKTLENFEVVVKLLKENAFNPVEGVEVGVRYGDFSEYLLRNFPDLSLHLVDPYLPYNDNGTEFTQQMQDKILYNTGIRLSCFNDDYRAVFHRVSSVDAARNFTAHNEAADHPYRKSYSFDFVFIDAEHTFDAVTADITAWFPLIRPGGLLMGHDFSMAPVKKAVINHPKLKDRHILHTGTDSDVWAIRV